MPISMGCTVVISPFREFRPGITHCTGEPMYTYVGACSVPFLERVFPFWNDTGVCFLVRAWSSNLKEVVMRHTVDKPMIP